jgi:sialic acid synthase SpsE
MQIGPLNTDERVIVVAEVGNNHEGSVEQARALVKAAAECGVHAVKFQTFRTRLFVGRSDTARYQRMSRFELPIEAFGELAALAHSLGILFISTPLDLESAAALETVVDAYKIASGDNNFYPLIARVCATGLPLLVSTGLSDLAEVGAVVTCITEYAGDRPGGEPELALLHCVSSYPAPIEQVNLAAIAVLREAFGLTVGYSDHAMGIGACVLAVAAGARIVEKHFTLDKNYSAFRDHQLSADPAEMRELVQEVARVAAIVGRPEKRPQPCEQDGIREFRRSIVAAGDLESGHRLTERDLMWLRPAGGVAPGEEHRLVGRTLRRAVATGERIQLADVT